MSQSTLLLSSLLKNQEYFKRVFPFIKEEYFEFEPERIIFSIISGYSEKYQSIPSIEAVNIELENKPLKQTIFDDCKECIGKISSYKNDSELQWLIDTTEKFCKDRALYLALQQSIEIASDSKDGKNKGITETIIPQLLSDAISISFDDSIGHDFFEDSEKRYELYHTVENKIPFDIDQFNRITNGGLSKKTTTIIVAGTNVGKTLMMCHFAANNLVDGKNVLYITLEMSYDEIAKRIEGNLMNVVVNEIKNLSKTQYMNNISSLKLKTPGKLIIYDDLSGNGNTRLFRRVIDDLKLKKNFIPDVIYIDYIGAMGSSVYKAGSVNTYVYYKSIAEEMRSLAKQTDTAIISAAQYNRSGFSSSDADMTHMAESFGINFSADFVFTGITSEELERLGQFEIKQLKNRYQNKAELLSFRIGVDKPKMRLFSLEASRTEPVIDSASYDFRMSENDLNRKLENLQGFKF